MIGFKRSARGADEGDPGLHAIQHSAAAEVCDEIHD